MSAKIASVALCLVFGVQALVAQALCGCGGNAGYNGLAGYGALGGYNGVAGYGALGGYNGLGLSGAYGSGCGATGVASTGGGLAVSSASVNAPLGISVLSDVGYEGQLAANGNLPFLGTVSVEGVLPTGGIGAVTYGCGSGDVGISAEGPISTGIVVPGAIYPPAISPSAGALADARAIVPSFGSNYASGLGNIAGYGLGGISGYGLGGVSGYGLGGISGYGLGGISGYGASGCGCL